MIDDGRIPLTGNKEYDDLPESVKALYSLREYLWLSDVRKASLISEECEPEFEEVGG